MKRRRASPAVRLKPEPLWEQITRRNMSQNDLARRAEISSGYLSQLIGGKKSPSPDVRRRLQAALEISRFDELFVMEYRDE
ncbi:MAG: helix-turn-helix transcriptional regulator [Chloroflexi bacterium]|nr:helix-turn-helix transcriptional regulator [Chloroflexota bacterium]MCY3696072.1 helix-turn-helix transcriptional regulator [Chloroflexota bacterium]